jgi:hypothetical protein
MATADDELGRFLLELLPDEARAGLRRLAELRYQSPDLRSLAEQLGGDAESVSGSSLVCTDGTCTKTCGLTVTIPSIGLAIG